MTALMKKVDIVKIVKLLDAYRRLLISLVISALVLFVLVKLVFTVKNDLEEHYETEVLK